MNADFDWEASRPVRMCCMLNTVVPKRIAVMFADVYLTGVPLVEKNIINVNNSSNNNSNPTKQAAASESRPAKKHQQSSLAQQQQKTPQKIRVTNTNTQRTAQKTPATAATTTLRQTVRPLTNQKH